MKKQAITCTLTITIILLSLFSAAIIQPCNASTESVSNFSIIWITDTQYLSASHPTSFDNLTQWIADNNSTYNIKMVIHTGDIVDTEGNRTQWLNANQSMSILLNNDVPYCWDAGNHDYNDTCWIGNQYAAFNPQTMQAEPYWVSDDYNGMNTAVHFIASGMDWLVVNIAFHANDSVLAWANNLLDANPQSHVIIATHAYIDGPCRYDSWATHLKATVLDRHANVFLTLNGHYHPASASRTQVGGRDELFFNQQDNSSELGADSARILTFDTAKGTINVQTYDPYSNHFLQDNGDNFTLNSAFHSDLVGKNDLMAPVFVVVVGVVLAFSVGVAVFVVRNRKLRGR